MLWLTIVVCIFIYFSLKYNKNRPLNSFKPDIILSPGGYYGLYTLGVCHFIKNHYDVSKKTKLGFSSGSFNGLFMTMDKSKDNEFLTHLFKTNVHHKAPLHKLTDAVTSCVLEHYTITDFDLSTLYVGLSHLNELGVYHNFLTLEEVIRCCIGSSFVPFITYKDLIYIYKQKLTLDGGLLYYKYLETVDTSKTLIIRPSMFDRFKKTRNLGRGLMRQNNTLYGLYLQGYRDATDNKAYLDKYLKDLSE